ncbi:hypothetical protein BpHYR1_019808 [Brachionus plicatilis]|uniref:Uncharacterized protein n=1 Tax=Brachionus plicatilis TaxID=10195 RepID=A0A3M7SY49_BRAPC|nr:hypothetical protein BpHYR1_019808 [Brachionus plicatilis]
MLRVQEKRLHFALRIADANQTRYLCGLVGHAALQHLALFELPAVACQVDARRRTKETLLVAVRLLRHFCIKYDDCVIVALFQVSPHCFTRQSSRLARLHTAIATDIATDIATRIVCYVQIGKVGRYLSAHDHFI